ncbi:transposase [Lysinibacillus sp. RS5]|uniref:transposase n=1 Tax=unclassified Lysinibacillus TaxID=2636778 RepID=UPI0035BE3EF0
MKRVRYATEYKIKIAKEAIEYENISLIARKNNLSPNMANRWVREYREGKYMNDEKKIMFSQTEQLILENDRLKLLLGEKNLEIALLKDLINK